MLVCVNIPLVVILIVFLLIAMRRLGRLRFAIWQVMVAGAAAVLLTGQIGVGEAFRAVDPDVMLFLFGMFVVGETLVASGYLYVMAYRLFSRTASADALVITVLFGAGLASALLMNDTVAIIGTPLMLRLAREHRINAKLLLLALAFAVTIGSVPSPIGNPQNLLIAIRSGMASPFWSFMSVLAIPSLLNLLLAYGVLRLLFWRAFHSHVLVHKPVEVSDAAMARLGRLSLLVVIALVAVKAGLAAAGRGSTLPLSWIAIAAALPPLLFSPRRWTLLRDIDWRTLAFFAAMFVLTDAVWRTGYVQLQLVRWHVDLVAPHTVMGLSLGLSQLISNVPLVALYLPLLSHAGASTQASLALAVGSTIAGNLLILGAASNIIIIQNAEKRGATLTFLEFARAGIPLTMLNVVLYWHFVAG